MLIYIIITHGIAASSHVQHQHRRETFEAETKLTDTLHFLLTNDFCLMISPLRFGWLLVHKHILKWFYRSSQIHYEVSRKSYAFHDHYGPVKITMVYLDEEEIKLYFFSRNLHSIELDWNKLGATYSKEHLLKLSQKLKAFGEVEEYRPKCDVFN